MLNRHSNAKAITQAALLSQAVFRSALLIALVIMISSCTPASARSHKVKPKSSADFDKAVVVYNQKHYQQAAASFESLVVKEPANPNASYYAGLSYQAMGNQSRARQMYQRTAKYFPKTQAGNLASKLLAKMPRAPHGPAKTTTPDTATAKTDDTAADASATAPAEPSPYMQSASSLLKKHSASK